MTTLTKAVQLFLGEYETRPATRKSYYYDLNAMVSYIGGARPIEEIKPIHVLEYIQHLRGRYHQRQGIKSPATLNKNIKTLKVFWKWCVDIELLPTSPAAKIVIEKVHHGVDPDKVMPPQTYEKLKQAARHQKKKRILALVLFLGDTACRIGGAAALRWQDVDLDRGTAETYQKGKSAQTVDFGPDCRAALRAWKKQQEERKKGDYVFSDNGRRMTNDSLGQFFARFCQDAELGTWGPHSVRHLWAFRALDSGIPMVEVAAALGNTVAVTEQNYGHYRQENIRKNFLRLASRDIYPPITPLHDAG